MFIRFLIPFIFLFVASGANAEGQCKINGKWYPIWVCTSGSAFAYDGKKIHSSESRSSSKPSYKLYPSAKSSNSKNPVCNIQIRKVINDIKVDLNKRHPFKYSIQKVLLDKNLVAYKELCNQPVSKEGAGVLQGLLDRHYPKFSVIQVLYKKNMKSHKELQEPESIQSLAPRER